jgi:hypothetical protein
MAEPALQVHRQKIILLIISTLRAGKECTLSVTASVRNCKELYFAGFAGFAGFARMPKYCR